jgi:hypothetical protein
MPFDWLTILLTARRSTAPTTDEWQFLCDAVSHLVSRDASRAWRDSAAYPFEGAKEETR